MHKLIIADDEGKTTVVPLVRDEITIGRKEGNTIRLTDRNVSRRHAKLERSNGQFIIFDLESYNGVRVNGTPVDGSVPLNEGDQIVIGDYLLSLRSDRPVAEPEPRPPTEAAPASTPYPRLVMVGSPEPGKEFALHDGELVVGRTEDNEVCINHRSISRSHARLLVREGACRLIDLDSANGVRVNGEEYMQVELRTGDLVELGTVKLRFIAAGEPYQFDADSTIQMESPAYLAEEPRRRTLPILLGVAAVLLVAVGAYFALTWPPEWLGPAGGGHAGPTTGPGIAGPDKVPTGPTTGQVLAQAERFYKLEDFEGVLATLAGVPPVDSDSPRVVEMRKSAALEVEAQRSWRRACIEASQEDVAAVFHACKLIPAESMYNGRGCCGDAGSRFAEAQIRYAEELLKRKNYQGALTTAREIAAGAEFSSEARTKAESLVALATQATQPPTGLNPPDKIRQPGPGKTGPGPDATTKTDRRPAAEAMAEARQCLTDSNDQRCCIRALQGAERTPQVLNLLLSCYQGAGESAQACALARRSPGSPNAQQLLATGRCD